MGSEIQRVDPSEFRFDERQAYDRLDNESVDEFTFARAYFDMPSRSMGKLADDIGVPRNRLQVLAKKHSWTARAEALDVEIARRALKNLESRQVEVRTNHSDIAQKMLDKVSDKLDDLMNHEVYAKDLPALLDVASKLQRVSVGLQDTKRVEITGRDGNAIQIVQSLDSSDRHNFLRDAQAELNRRLALDNIVDAEVIDDVE